MVTKHLTEAAKSFSLTVFEFGAFLRRPHTGGQVEHSIREKVVISAGLFALSILITLVFGLLALPMILSNDLTGGEQIDEARVGSAWTIILSLVLLGPLVEEIIFRGWLSGVWRAILATLVSLLVIYGGSELLEPYFAESGTTKQLVLLIGALVALFAFSPLDRSRRIRGFNRLFPVIFYGQAIAFGTLHFQNYAASSLFIALFATFPLIACGLIWGYARIRIGLTSAVVLHSAYNVPAAIGSIIMMHLAG